MCAAGGAATEPADGGRSHGAAGGCWSSRGACVANTIPKSRLTGWFIHGGMCTPDQVQLGGAVGM